MSKKPFKIVTLGDHCLTPSGVGIQTRYMIEGLLKTGNYQFRCLGGAIKHQDYRPQKVEEYGDDWIIFPIDGYGDENLVRELLDEEKPDAIWFMTDARFYGFLFNMSDEIRDRGVPMLWNSIWDNYPVPDFNKPFYQSCDFVGCISKLTHDIVCQLGMEDSSGYIPHAVDADIYKPIEESKLPAVRSECLNEHSDKFVVLSVGRNARRKMTSDIIKTFKLFLDEVGQDKAFLLLHCDPHDPEGANLIEVVKMLGLTPDQVAFSNSRLPPEEMAKLYGMADVTINISNNEGFGLCVLSALSCGTLTIINRTGGLQDQNIDDEGNVFGVRIEPATKSLTGSQQIPYIFDDRCSDEDVVAALKTVYDMGHEERQKLGLKARAWTEKRFNMKDMVGAWDKAFTEQITKYREHGNPNRIKCEKI